MRLGAGLPKLDWQPATRNGSDYRTRFVAAILALAFIAASNFPSPSHAADRYLRPNRLGYGVGEAKVARVLSKTNLSGATWRVMRWSEGTMAFSGTLPASSGAWGSFPFTYRLDFTGLDESGEFRLNLQATGENSVIFVIEDPLAVAPGYKPLARSLLGFFGVQRCGPTSPVDHEVCHLLDAHHIVGGPNAGQARNVTGGWHDAGDYIKFATTVAYSTHLLLWAHEIRPNLAGDWNSNGIADLLDEAKIGARFLLKLRYQPGRFLYQVSDGADHAEGWRLPEDDELTPNRPAYYGPGKNHLGRYIAALARAARSYASISPGFADSCRAAALDAYTALATAPNLVNNGFYDDGTHQDKVALGAIELYLTTGLVTYLNAAKSNADAVGPGYWSGWGTLNGLADALLAPYHAPALANLLTDVSTFRTDANAHPFGMAGTEVWGTNLVITSMAAEALLYERLTGDGTYNSMAWSQRDFVLGANPWGVCFVGSTGGLSPIDFHHQIATIVHGGALPGALTEGPAPLADIQGQGIVLDDPDEHAEFQASRGTYHDDRANYVTNEPTIAANASMIFMLALFADRHPPTAIEEGFDPAKRITVIAASPNPFRGSTTLFVGGPATSGDPVVRIYDAAGRFLRQIEGRGRTAVAWDGLDAQGREVPNGIYYLASPGTARGRVTRLR